MKLDRLINLLGKPLQTNARQEALQLATRRSQSVAGTVKEGLPPSELQKSATRAVKGISSGNWNLMKSFLRTESVGAGIFGNTKAVRHLDKLRSRV